MREVINVVWYLSLALWPVSAIAAGNSLGNALIRHSLVDWAALMLLSTVSGLVALLNRVRKSMEAEARQKVGENFVSEDIVLIDWKAFALFHMTGSYVAGMVAFFITEELEMGGYYEAAAIAVAAWVGAQLMDVVAGVGVTRVAAMFGAVAGRKTEG